MKPYIIEEDKWRITADPLSFRIEEYMPNAKGKKAYWRPYGYYGTIEDLLRSWTNLSIRTSDKEMRQAIMDAGYSLGRIKRDLEVTPDADST